MEISLGGVEVKKADEAPSRFSALFWGMAGCGKTTLAATAPGAKLWINFDPDGLVSIAGLPSTVKNPDSALAHPIYQADFSGEPARFVDKFKTYDGLGLAKVFDANPDIETVVVDSMTRFSQMCLEYTLRAGHNHGAKVDIEKPGMSAWGGRNALAYRMFVDIFSVTKKYNKNVIFITHEAAPTTNDKGELLFITMALGGQLPILGGAQVSEVWYISETQRGERRIAVRPTRGYKPMKTRMFNTSVSDPEFKWDYDVNNPNPKMEIATWWKEFRDGGNQKLQLPGK